MALWNPWHGCHKVSDGCKNCYVYSSDERHGRDASEVYKTKNFNLPTARKKDGTLKIPPGEMIYTCFTSDFLIEEADGWRDEAWDMMRARPDCRFLFITKRIERLEAALPPDWGDGWEHVAICVTCENQDRADFRAPIFAALPIKHCGFACSPLLGPIDLSSYLNDTTDLGIVAGGESGKFARPCHYDWVISLQRQCVSAKLPFTFDQTGARFVKDGKIYAVPRKLQHSQARKAGINFKQRGLKRYPSI